MPSSPFFNLSMNSTRIRQLCSAAVVKCTLRAVARCFLVDWRNHEMKPSSKYQKFHLAARFNHTPSCGKDHRDLVYYCGSISEEHMERKRIETCRVYLYAHDHSRGRQTTEQRVRLQLGGKTETERPCWRQFLNLILCRSLADLLLVGWLDSGEWRWRHHRLVGWLADCVQ